jgi:hypothetical protein
MASHHQPAIRPRSLANVLLDLKEARRDWEQAIDEIARLPIGVSEADDADDRASEADTRVDDLRDEFTARFHEVTGLTWKQIEDAISEAVL